jgi:abortive infection bacteriophage resistance protein
MKYEKPWLDYGDLLDRHIDRGLVVPDRPRAMRWLKQVSYYRLSAYCLPFKQEASENYRAGTTFDDVAGLYIFDRKLRLILLDAIERIEVALRAHLTHVMSRKYGVFGLANRETFSYKFPHDELLDALAFAEADQQETFVRHFRGKYTAEKHLPMWMALELLSFGKTSQIYADAVPEVKRSFAQRFDVPDIFVVSWMHAICYVRNVCAHHKRLWNRTLAIRPRLLSNAKHWPYAVERNDGLYAVLVIVRHCLTRIAPHCQWRERLFELFDAHPAVPLRAMQIPDDWRSKPPWS